MRSNHGVRVLVLGAGVAALCIGACKKPAEEAERKEASTTELRSARDHDRDRDRKRIRKLETTVIDEEHDAVAVVRREQLDLRAQLQTEIAAIDGRIAELKVELYEGGYLRESRAKAKARIEALAERRMQLQHDVVMIERADEHGWNDLKATIEKDLKDGRPRERL